MARATFVKKARKDVKGTDIKAGESYYWWKFKRGGKHFSRTAPRRSQLTQSAFYGAVYDIEDEVAEAEASESLVDLRDDIVSRLQELGEECQGNLDNMPEGLQQGSTGELLQERIDAMESAASEFEDIELEPFEATMGSEVTADDPQDEDGKCKACDQDDRHTLECEHNIADEVVNDDEQTEEEYWAGKLEELQGISIEAP